ncbi:hypothetical protein JCM33374_g1213 [Metschnikowia sp. JCM 33374]|nr:hypothetical protein JCM33374_g1213 [Metschnikowia sp. JCM 33374]
MNIMSSMSQWSQASDLPTSGGQPSQDSTVTSVEGSQDAKPTNETSPATLNTDFSRTGSVGSVSPSPATGNAVQTGTTEVKGFTNQWLNKGTPYNQKKTIKLLVKGVPSNMKDYAEHLYKVSCLLYDGELTYDQTNKLERKFVILTGSLSRYSQSGDPSKSQLYLVVEKCFDVFIKMSMNSKKMEVATHTIRFLTTLVMDLNYWEIYNLLRWRPAIYQFLMLINFDLHECYTRFIREYQNYTYKQEEIEEQVLYKAKDDATRKRRGSFSDISTPDASDNESTSFDTQEPVERAEVPSPSRVKENQQRKRPRTEPKPSNHRVVQRAEFKLAPSTRSSNYDPDVVHECQLPAPEDPSKVCLRRFSRKYELIRHQETVHSKKKKLFKCYVCVKQDPSIGPRIFTRHDTLAKHIRVNHRISGKEAKAEVAYSKKHAEIVEEGDITVHVGRRKTKVDFELRAHMDKKGAAREGPDGSIIFDEIDESAPDSIHSGDEGLY